MACTEGVPRERSPKKANGDQTLLELLVLTLACFIYAGCPFPFLQLPTQLGQVIKVRAPGAKEREGKVPVRCTKAI